MSPTSPNPGPGVDASGDPIPDPTRNVLDLVEAAIRRQDDLRKAADAHVREIAQLRAEYDRELRKAESARIDAIRAVDVGAVNRAAEVAGMAATSLAAAVAASAEALRTQVSAAATAATVALAAEIDPLKKDIADLRRAQYEQAGVRAQTVDQRTDSRSSIGTILGVVGGLVGVAGLVLAIVLGLR